MGRDPVIEDTERHYREEAEWERKRIKCDKCGDWIDPDDEVYEVKTEYGYEDFCKDCAIDYLNEEYSELDLINLLFVHRSAE